MTTIMRMPGWRLPLFLALLLSPLAVVLFTSPVQAQQNCQLGQVNDFKVESSGGVFTATWDYPDGCDATTFPTDFEIDVEWKRVSSINVGNDGDGVIWDDGSWDDFREATCEEGTVTTTCTFGRNTIETGEQFVVRVKTVGNNGSETTRRVEVWPVVASNPPDPVTGTVASPEANDSCTVVAGRKATPIELSWDAVSGVSNYQIWRAGPENTFSESFRSDRVLASNVSGTSHTDDTQTRGRQTYLYVVFPRRGGTAFLDGKWSVALVQTPGPDRPGNVSAVDGDTEDRKFTVSWSTPSDDGGCDITGYAIYLYEYKYLADGSVEVDSDGELPFVSEGTAGASATSWESPSMTTTYHADDGRDYGRQFHVEVRAVTAHREGVPSSTLFTGWNRPISPNAPRDLSITERGSDLLGLGWKPPDSDGGSPITRYTVTYQPNGGDSGSSSKQETRGGGAYGLDARSVGGVNPRSENGGGSVDTTGTSVTITGLTDGVEYIVRVVAHNEVGESPPSDPVTGTPGGAGNTPATGTPTISGDAYVGETLTADTSAVEDADGLGNAVFEYQWLAEDTEVAGATSSTYTPVDADQGKTLRVRVSFTDDADNQESLTSAPTAAVAAAPTPLTAEIGHEPASHNGTDAFTFRIAFSEDIAIKYRTFRDHSLKATGGSVTKAKRVNKRKDLWEVTVEPDSNAGVTVVLPITEDCAAQGAVCTSGGKMLSNRLELTVSGPGG